MNYSISLNTVLSTMNGGSLLSFLSSVVTPTYGIYYAIGDNANESALDFTSVVKFNIAGSSVITSAPVGASSGVAGSYASINKVNQPSKISMRVTVEGMTGFSGKVPRIPLINNKSVMTSSRTDVIEKLEQMKNSATVYNIETPDRVYPNYDLINYEFVVQANSGITLLAVDLIFQEIKIFNTKDSGLKKETTLIEAIFDYAKKVIT